MGSFFPPGQVYDSKAYTIIFPDSLYTGGSISIKKLKINGVKSSAEFYISNNRYTILQFTLNKKNKKRFVKQTAELFKGYQVDIEKKGFKYKITIRLKE